MYLLDTNVVSELRKDPRQGAKLRAWLDTRLLPAFQDRILPVDTVVAQCCARLHVPDPRADRDALIAATALVYDLSVVTRNTADLTVPGLAVLNPWAG